jgi:protein-L-isoaspartate(D-aspartate) O-methyltransferase
VLAELGVRVFSIEIVPELADHARAVLAQEGYTNNVQVLTGDGYKGWPEKAPFDAVMVTCAPDEIPKTLVEQLKEGGRMILPVGGWMGQRLVILKKRGGKVEQTDDLPVRFVPMVKEAGR